MNEGKWESRERWFYADEFETEWDGKLYFRKIHDDGSGYLKEALFCFPKDSCDLGTDSVTGELYYKVMEDDVKLVTSTDGTNIENGKPFFKEWAYNLPDSGARREFKSGAVRDIQEGKGRCDLLPLDIIFDILERLNPNNDLDTDQVINYISSFVETGDQADLIDAIEAFCDTTDHLIWTVFLEVSKHYEAGAKKYSARNWEKGIPLHCFIDSGVRHYLKFKRGDTDEPHDRAFVWNMLGALWTMKHHPELDDITGDHKYEKENS